MKKIRLLLLCCICFRSLYAQTITQIEYFIDNDTGYGNGIPVSFAQDSSVTVSFSVNIAGALTEGFHFLNIRAKDSGNQWSMVGIRPFYNQLITNDSLADIAGIEYFIDTDPGYGSGNSISFTANIAVSQSVQIPVPPDLSEGLHFLNVRARDTNHKWTIVAIRPFYNQPIANNSLADITAIEYFVDADPGYGSGTSVSFTSNNNVNRNFPVAIPPHLSDGFHTLMIRAKDAQHKWSIVGSRPFYKQRISGNALENIVAVEYFIDTDPGAGNATPVAIIAGTTLTRDFLLNLDSLANGSHRLYMRARNAANKWSLLSMRDFMVQDNIIIIQNMPADWCASTNFNIPLVLYGTYNTGNVFTAQLSDANGNFDLPVTIGTLTSVNTGTITGNIPDSVGVGNNYRIRVVSSSPAIENSPVKPFRLLSVCPPPCADIITLNSWNDDYVGEQVIIEANETNGSIIAGNQVRNNAHVIYRSGRSITLNPGFSVNNGAVFKTEFGGCN